MPSNTGAVAYRAATVQDADAIAALHADSWRRNYRGAYADSFLDGDVYGDRRQVWTERLVANAAATRTIVAETDGRVLGFAHAALDDHPTWGALLDNLHVAHDRKRQGIGGGLMARIARAIVQARPRSRLYLWVLEQNRPAQAFYESLGGKVHRAGTRGAAGWRPVATDGHAREAALHLVRPRAPLPERGTGGRSLVPLRGSRSTS